MGEGDGRGGGGEGGMAEDGDEHEAFCFRRNTGRTDGTGSPRSWMPAPTNLPGPQSAVDGLQVLRNAVVVVRRRRTTAVAGGPLARSPRPEPTLPHATAAMIARAYCASHPQCPSYASKSGAGTYWTATYETLSKRRDHKPWRKATTFLGSGQQEVTTKVPAGRGRGWR